MTDPTPPEHEHSEAIGEAARWYAANSSIAERPLVPNMVRRFGLSPTEAVAALIEGGRLARQGGADG